MAETEDQKATIDLLSRPETYGVRTRVERIDTHGAIVFLAGDRAYKLKRAVRYPYMDYSTSARRKAMCEAELEINRRTAPDLYLGVEPVTRKGGALTLGGEGKAVDWVVVMRRFDGKGLFNRLAEKGKLNPDLMRALAEEIVQFHGSAKPRKRFGGSSGTMKVIDGIAESFTAVAETFNPSRVEQVTAGLRALADEHATLLEARRAAGEVRHCHGDLHLGNIVLIDGKPVLFDAIEFAEDIANIDVLYDLAFLLMDLEHRKLRELANLVLNAYLARAGGHDGLALLPLFLAMRAAIRAHVTATAAASQATAARTRTMRAAARGYLDRAVTLLAPVPPVLVAVGGVSGTGKSTLAYRLAPEIGRAPGAVVVRSDEIRKALFGVGPTTRLGSDAYRPEVSRRVYREAIDRAVVALGAGQSVIADAVFDRAEDRAAIEAAAAAARVPFVGLWLDAPAATLVRRVGARAGDASDADAAVVERQLEHDPGAIDWHRLDAGGDTDDVYEAAAPLVATPT